MSENLQKLLKEALLNNTYDYDSMHNTLKKTWMNSFSYLYTSQKAQIEYEELFYFSNDVNSRNSKLMGGLYLDNTFRACFNVDYDLIHVLDREEFRLSDFYLNEFSFKDLVYHPEIFLKMPILIIDNQVIWDYKIRVTKDCTRFILPFKRNFVLSNERKPDTEDIIYLDHTIQVLIVDNIYYQRILVNKNTLSFNKTDKTIKIDKSLLESLSMDVIKADTESELFSKWKITSASEMNNNHSYEFKKEYNRRLDLVHLPKQDGTMMCSIHFPNQVNKAYELGTQIIPLENHEDYYTAHLTDDIVTKMIEHRLNIYVSVWHVNHLYHHKFYTGETTTTATEEGADLLVVQQDELLPYKSPIPVENFMVFKKSENSGYSLQKNTEMLDMYYPNIYRIKDETLKSGDVYDVYYFYYDFTELKYTVLFDFYYSFLIHLYDTKSIEEIMNDIYYNRADFSMYTNEQQEKFIEIFTKLMSYKYYDHQYAETDFMYRYLPIPGNEDKAPVEYKIETLKEWIRVEPWVLRNYVLEQNKLGASYHLFTNTLDLTTRIRYSTEQEIGEPTRLFDEPRYVFAFNNEKDYPILLNCRVFVDGILIGDLYQERHLFMDYLYVPMDLVTDDSYIEIEIFPGYEYEKDLTFITERTNIKVVGNILTIIDEDASIEQSMFDMDSGNFGTVDHEEEAIDLNDYNRRIKVDLDDPTEVITPTISDLYLLNEDQTEVYKKEDFDFTLHYPNADYEFESGDPGLDKPVYFSKIDEFSIKPHDKSLLRKPLHLKITKIPRVVRFVTKRQGYAYIELAEKGVILDTEYIRVYRNGRLLPRCKYVIKSFHNRPIVMFLDWFEAGDIIYIDITPYRYKEIYYQEELSKDNTLIDLRTIINKPFDIRYYDVYLNGRKLSLNNVFSITPWQITLVNLKSTYNLVIYERERDWEYFGLDYKENIYYFTLDELFKSGIVSDDIKNEIIKEIIDGDKDPRLNIYPNTNDEEKMNQDADDLITVEFYLYYYDRLLPFMYINPDMIQEESEFLEAIFTEIHNAYVVSIKDDSMSDIERARRENYPNVVCLNPDLHFGADGGPGPYLIYEVGHMTDDVDKVYLEQEVKFPTEGNIDKK